MYLKYMEHIFPIKALPESLKFVHRQSAAQSIDVVYRIGPAYRYIILLTFIFVISLCGVFANPDAVFILTFETDSSFTGELLFHSQINSKVELLSGTGNLIKGIAQYNSIVANTKIPLPSVYDIQSNPAGVYQLLIYDQGFSANDVELIAKSGLIKNPTFRATSASSSNTHSFQVVGPPQDAKYVLLNPLLFSPYTSQVTYTYFYPHTSTIPYTDHLPAQSTFKKSAGQTYIQRTNVSGAVACCFDSSCHLSQGTCVDQSTRIFVSAQPNTQPNAQLQITAQEYVCSQGEWQQTVLKQPLIIGHTPASCGQNQCLVGQLDATDVCIDSSYGNYVCQNGKWISKITQLSSELQRLAKDYSFDSYSVYCDDFSKVINSYLPFDSTIIDAQGSCQPVFDSTSQLLSKNPNPACIQKACVLTTMQNAQGQNPRTLFAFSYGENTTPLIFSNRLSDAQVVKQHELDSWKLQPELRIVIYDPYHTSVSVWQTISNSISGFFSAISTFLFGTNSLPIPVEPFETLYLGVSDNTYIVATRQFQNSVSQSMSYIDNRTVLIHSTTNWCDFVSANCSNEQTKSGWFLSRVVLDSTNQQQANKQWELLTTKLR
jgi:hypothetical protein